MSQNYTQAVVREQVTAEEFTNNREALGFGQSDLSRALGIPLRTLQDYEAGKRAIPKVVHVALALYRDRDSWLMDKITQSVEEQAVRDYPHMFRSAHAKN